MTLPTYEEIKPYIEKGLVSEQTHPEDENVRIFNYTQECQFSKAWDDVTRQCRGLILNVATGEVIARPFPKFFNYQEHVQNNWPVPDDEPIVYEKLDGSLGILYVLNGQYWVATRGSFMSDQAQWATKWYREHVGTDPKDFVREVTHLFEIIYPENRIVVSYDFSGLVYLATLDNATGNSLGGHIWEGPVRNAKVIRGTNVEALLKMDEPNSEGFVIYYPKENVRMKVKFAEYVRLHKLVTGVSEIAIWEHLRDGNGLQDLLEKVPDEFFKWVESVQNELKGKYDAIEQEARNDYNAITNGDPAYATAHRESAYRKDFALKATKKRHPGILFAMLDNKPYDHIIWKMIRPHGRSSFKVDIDT